MDYSAIYDKMEDNVWYTAKELGAASASMRAMGTRGLVEIDRTYSPMKYRKINTSKHFFSAIAALNSLKTENGLAIADYDNRRGEYVEKKSDGAWYHCDGKRKITVDDTAHITKVYYYRAGQIAQCIELKNKSIKGEKNTCNI